MCNWEILNVPKYNYKLKAYSGSVRNPFSSVKDIIIKPDIQECFSLVLQRKTFLTPIEPFFRLLNLVSEDVEKA